MLGDVGVELRACEGAGEVAAVGAEVEDIRELPLDVLFYLCQCLLRGLGKDCFDVSYQHPLRKSMCDLVLEIVHLTTFVDISGGAVFLYVLGFPVEDLERRCA